MSNRKSARLLVALGVCAAALVGVAFLGLSGSAHGTTGPVARDLFGVFRAGTPAAPDVQISDLADEVGADATDRAEFRVLQAGLGTFHSRLLAFPARSGHNVCYSLLGARAEDPGLSYCYHPHAPGLPAGLADERFSVVALQSVTDGQIATQVFGIAEDSVASVRIAVAGRWQVVTLKRNGFYLDLEGIAQSDVGVVEVTLNDGSTQLHDVQAGI